MIWRNRLRPLSCPDLHLPCPPAALAQESSADRRTKLAADRTPDVCQSQSVNVFLPGDVDKWDLHMLHWMAWERGCKSLYYLRSKSVQRAAHAGGEGVVQLEVQPEGKTDYEECLACQ